MSFFSQSRKKNIVRRLAIALLACTPAALAAQSQHARSFAVGERAVYDVKYGLIHAGTASLSVMGIDTVRDHDAYRFRLTFNAGINLLLLRYHARDTMQSWVDTATFHSLRFNQDQLDGGRSRTKRYEIFPERAVYRDGTQPEQASVSDPLDDIAFLFFVRRQDLTVGTTKEWAKHFKPGTNPVILKVLGKDTIDVAGKRWPTIVVQPVIKTSSFFSKDGEARVWLSDDSARVIVQINTKLSVGSITMRLTSYQPSAASASASARSPASEDSKKR